MIWAETLCGSFHHEHDHDHDDMTMMLMMLMMMMMRRRKTTRWHWWFWSANFLGILTNSTKMPLPTKGQIPRPASSSTADSKRFSELACRDIMVCKRSSMAATSPVSAKANNLQKSIWFIRRLITLDVPKKVFQFLSSRCEMSGGTSFCVSSFTTWANSYVWCWRWKTVSKTVSAMSQIKFRESSRNGTIALSSSSGNRGAVVALRPSTRFCWAAAECSTAASWHQCSALGGLVPPWVCDWDILR